MNIRYFFCAALCFLATSCAITFEETVAYPPQSVEGWHQEFGDFGRVGHILESVPPGETVKDWSQIFTIQYFNGNDASLEEALVSMESRIKSACPDLVMKRIARTPESITYEFWTMGTPPFEAQHELGKFFTGDTGLHRVAFAAKGGRMAPSMRSTWLANINRCMLYNPQAEKELTPTEKSQIEGLVVPVIEKRNRPLSDFLLAN